MKTKDIVNLNGEVIVQRLSSGEMLISSAEHIIWITDGDSQVRRVEQFSSVKSNCTPESACNILRWIGGVLFGLKLNKASTACSKAVTRISCNGQIKTKPGMRKTFGKLPKLGWFHDCLTH